MATNVPENIRTMWTDLYKLFDRYYKLPNTPEAWEDYWKSAMKLCQQYKSNRFAEACCLVADCINDRIKAEIRTQEVESDA